MQPAAAARAASAQGLGQARASQRWAARGEGEGSRRALARFGRPGGCSCACSPRPPHPAFSRTDKDVSPPLSFAAAAQTPRVASPRPARSARWRRSWSEDGRGRESSRRPAPDLVPPSFLRSAEQEHTPPAGPSLTFQSTLAGGALPLPAPALRPDVAVPPCSLGGLARPPIARVEHERAAGRHRRGRLSEGRRAVVLPVSLSAAACLFQHRATHADLRAASSLPGLSPSISLTRPTRLSSPSTSSSGWYRALTRSSWSVASLFPLSGRAWPLQTSIWSRRDGLGAERDGSRADLGGPTGVVLRGARQISPSLNGSGCGRRCRSQRTRARIPGSQQCRWPGRALVLSLLAVAPEWGRGVLDEPAHDRMPQRTATDLLLRRNSNRTSSALAASRSPRSSRTPRPVRPPGHSLPPFLLSRLTSLIFSSQRQPSSAGRARPSFASPAAARPVLRRAARSAVRTEAGAIDDDLT